MYIYIHTVNMSITHINMYIYIYILYGRVNILLNPLTFQNRSRKCMRMEHLEHQFDDIPMKNGDIQWVLGGSPHFTEQLTCLVVNGINRALLYPLNYTWGELTQLLSGMNLHVLTTNSRTNNHCHSLYFWTFFGRNSKHSLLCGS